MEQRPLMNERKKETKKSGELPTLSSERNRTIQSDYLDRNKKKTKPFLTTMAWRINENLLINGVIWLSLTQSLISIGNGTFSSICFKITEAVAKVSMSISVCSWWCSAENEEIKHARFPVCHYEIFSPSEQLRYFFSQLPPLHATVPLSSLVHAHNTSKSRANKKTT